MLFLSAFIDELVKDLDFSFTSPHWIRPLNMYFMISLCFFLVFYNLRPLAPKCRFKKGLFLSRVFLYPLMSISYWAAFGIAVNHGIEYLGVYKLMSARSKMNRNTIVRSWIVFFSLSLVYTGFLFFRSRDGLIIFFNEKNPLPIWIIILASTSFGLSFLHYYQDFLLFRFRRPESKKFILPLVK